MKPDGRKENEEMLLQMGIWLPVIGFLLIVLINLGAPTLKNDGQAGMLYFPLLALTGFGVLPALDAILRRKPPPWKPALIGVFCFVAAIASSV